MVKKVISDFNKSQFVRDYLTATPGASSQEVRDALQKADPSGTINRNSFSVLFYTTRQKLGITTKRERKSKGKASRFGVSSSGTVSANGSLLTQAANFVRSVGGFENAISAVKTVQAIQLH